MDNKELNNENNSEEKSKNELIKTETQENKSVSKKEEEWPYPVNVIKEEVVKVLQTCFDPEIPVDVYQLGLIYDILVAQNGDVLVVMTLTSPSCPVAGTLPNEIEEKIKAHPMVRDARVEITFDPPWEMSMMSEEAKLELGFM